MAGFIKNQDLEEVRNRARIEDIVGEHVSLRGAGTGSLKGLCPFHDERTPSFHVRPGPGLWHCFGCGEGGDTISFVQKLNHLSFVEAVQYLADRYGVELRYEDGKGPVRGAPPGRRGRLIDAHRVAQQFYREQLDRPEAIGARDFLRSRSFGKEDVDKFGVGAAPDAWDGLLSHLRSKGFTDEEVITAGLAIQGNRGPYDRFRGRIMWPIRDLTGATIGFGARRIGDDPNQPKYLNTPETPIYKKSQVLYGIDLAKKDISRGRKVVVVEGYTDVMAAHAAGETTAVATCGTAFGAGHTQIIRRLLGDVASPAAGVVLADGRAPGGEVIFTFDGDEAGKAAARRAYVEDQTFAAQTFVAVDPNGMDPCDLRVKGGDQALRDLIASRVPLFQFVLRSVVFSLDLDNAEGRVQGARAAAPILAGIKDRALRSEYTRQVAGWLGMEPSEIESVQRALRYQRRPEPRQEPAQPRPDQLPSDATGRTERYALAAVLQVPLSTLGAGFESLEPDSFTVPAHRLILDAIGAAGGLQSFLDALELAEAEVGVGDASLDLATRRWGQAILADLDPSAASAVTAAMVTPLPVESKSDVGTYAQGVVRALVRRDLGRKVKNLQARLNRTQPGSPEHEAIFRELIDVETKRRSTVDPAAG